MDPSTSAPLTEANSEQSSGVSARPNVQIGPWQTISIVGGLVAFGGLVGGTIARYFATDEISELNRQDQSFARRLFEIHRTTFGTPESPRVHITDQEILNQRVPTLSDYLTYLENFAARDIAAAQKTLIQALENHRDKIEEKLQVLEDLGLPSEELTNYQEAIINGDELPPEAPQVVRDLSVIYSDISTALHPFTMPLEFGVAYMSDSHYRHHHSHEQGTDSDKTREHPAQYEEPPPEAYPDGDPIEEAKSAFLTMTGREVPEIVEFVFSDIPTPDIGGYTDELSTRVILDANEPGITPQEAAVHELGHLSCTSSQRYYEYLVGKKECDADQIRTLRAIDEAAARCFSAAAQTLLSPNDPTNLAITSGNRIGDVLGELRKDGPNEFGNFALADAYTEIYGTPGSAFNALNAAEEIDPRAIESMQHNYEWLEALDQRLIDTREMRAAANAEKDEASELISAILGAFDPR